MPLLETKGAASAQGFGGAGAGASGPVTYIEDVFSTYLYTGNGSTQTITNGIDLAGKGGLVWMKSRSAATTQDHFLMDTARGDNVSLSTNFSLGNDPGLSSYFDFNSSGFGFPTNLNRWNQSGQTYASWTFREQPKFFDVVTYTGDGANRTISHNLGSVPGCIIVKRTDATADWQVYHRSLANTQYLVLNTTAAVATGTTRWNSTTPTSTVFSLGTDTTVNANSGTYVAYLFAHDAGGFGLTGTDNVISCGSFTTDGSGIASVTLGYEPQYLLVKRTNSTSDWYIWDSMRGLTMDVEASLFANSSAVEEALVNFVNPTATGFVTVNGFAISSPYIYIAIRRGPMKTPTTGTSVFSPIASSAATGTALTTSFPVDAQIFSLRTGTTNKNNTYDRLRGVSSTTTESGARLITSSTAAETAAGNETRYWDNTGFQMPSTFGGTSTVFWNFRRAPGFFDEVCYTGDGVVGRTISHNLGVAPEFMIIKSRNNSANWAVYSGSPTSYMFLNSTAGSTTSSGYWNDTAPSASVFTVGGVSAVNVSSAYTYVAYLFATVAGVSKVGSYTGTGALQTINCGFTGGARFVLIKRTDSTGDWYVYDSARGISSGNDPYLFLNSTAAEVTGTNYVDTTSVGFQVTAAAPAGLNANGGTYIFLAIA